MAYQPNPFVNPEQRGVGLPPGCKDLIDVLKKGSGAEFYDGFAHLLQKRTATDQCVVTAYYGSGGFREIEPEVSKFLVTKAARKFLSVMDRPRHFFVTVFCDENVISLKVSVQPTQTAVKVALRRIFGKADLCQKEREREFLSVPLDGSTAEIARVLTELLRDGYGVKEGEELMFYAYMGGQK